MPQGGARQGFEPRLRFIHAQQSPRPEFRPPLRQHLEPMRGGAAWRAAHLLVVPQGHVHLPRHTAARGQPPERAAGAPCRPAPPARLSGTAVNERPHWWRRHGKGGGGRTRGASTHLGRAWSSKSMQAWQAGPCPLPTASYVLRRDRRSSSNAAGSARCSLRRGGGGRGGGGRLRGMLRTGRYDWRSVLVASAGGLADETRRFATLSEQSRHVQPAARSALVNSSFRSSRLKRSRS